MTQWLMLSHFGTYLFWKEENHAMKEISFFSEVFILYFGEILIYI